MSEADDSFIYDITNTLDSNAGDLAIRDPKTFSRVHMDPITLRHHNFPILMNQLPIISAYSALRPDKVDTFLLILNTASLINFCPRPMHFHTS